MEFVKQKAILLENKNPFLKIEQAGRICYASESKIKEGSAEKFVKNLIKSGHTAMLEHYTFCFRLHGTRADLEDYINEIKAYSNYLHATISYQDQPGELRALVSGNIRALNECYPFCMPLLKELMAKYPDLVWDQKTLAIGDDCNRIFSVQAELVDFDTLPNLSPLEIGEHKTMTFRLITNRGVTHELVRHRPCSFAQQSTRYINLKDGIQVVYPAEWDKYSDMQKQIYTKAFQAAEDHYRTLIESGQTPQQARAVLPIGLKTEIIVTANMKEWAWIYNLRLFGTTGAPHPDIAEVMSLAWDFACKDEIAAKYLRLACL